jgi:hypothetical protein
MKTIIAASVVLLMTGCASISGERMQPITVQTVHDNKEVAGIGCTLTNDAGSWFLTTPASISVHKSTGDLAISCKKDAFAGSQTLVSKSNGAVWGNILVGGGIGYIVDRNTGAGFDYPATTTVMLRKIGDDPVPPTDVAATPTPAAQGAMQK